MFFFYKYISTKQQKLFDSFGIIFSVLYFNHFKCKNTAY